LNFPRFYLLLRFWLHISSQILVVIVQAVSAHDTRHSVVNYSNRLYVRDVEVSWSHRILRK